jgi:hypothetical protein
MRSYIERQKVFSDESASCRPLGLMKLQRKMLRRFRRIAADIAWMPIHTGIPSTGGHMLRSMFLAVTTLSV